MGFYILQNMDNIIEVTIRVRGDKGKYDTMVNCQTLEDYMSGKYSINRMAKIFQEMLVKITTLDGGVIRTRIETSE